MRRSFIRSSFLGIAFASGLLAAVAPAQAPFLVESVSVPPNSVWQINRPIEIGFTCFTAFQKASL